MKEESALSIQRVVHYQTSGDPKSRPDSYNSGQAADVFYSYPYQVVIKWNMLGSQLKIMDWSSILRFFIESFRFGLFMWVMGI